MHHRTSDSFFWTLSLILLFFTGCEAAKKEAPEPTSATFLHQGMAREYLYYAPDNLGDKAPLVVVLHGFTSSAATIMEYTKFNALAEEHAFAVVYPQGTVDQEGRTFWNVGYDFHAETNTDDLDFIAKLVQFLQEEHGLSRSNTFAAGMSNGGEMCYLLACNQASTFRAVAPVAATMMNNRFADCQPARPIPLLAIFGTEDKTTNYLGDEQNQDGWGAYKSIPAVINFWANNLSYTTVATDTLANAVPGDSSFVVRTKYLNEKAPAEFLYYEVVGGGHDWPGAWGNEDLVASKEIWNFFKRQLKEE